jgi:methenyltetrahydromethanopterin cyclohydrolase
MEPLNRTATELVDEAIDFADELRVDVRHLENEAVVLDFGVAAPGGLEAGLLLAELRTGGLATVATQHGTLDGAPHTHVELSTDHPQLALLASQRTGWRLPDDGGWASGPGQLLRDDGPSVPGAPEETFDFAVLAVEADRLPDADLAAEIAGELGVPTAGTFIVVAPAASVAGATSLAAGAAEVALHRLEHLGGAPAQVQSATGRAPLPPVADDEPTAVARSNDAVAHGGSAHLVVDAPVDLAAELPFGATEHAGEPFDSLLETADGDLGALEDAFAPAAVTVDVIGGRSSSHGATDEAWLADAWGR